MGLDDPILVAALVAVLPKFTAGERIYTHNARVFRRELTSMLAFVGINDERFAAYTFRRVERLTF